MPINRGVDGELLSCGQVSAIRRRFGAYYFTLRLDEIELELNATEEDEMYRSQARSEAYHFAILDAASSSSGY